MENGVDGSGLRFQRRLQRGAGGEPAFCQGARFILSILSHRRCPPTLESPTSHHCCRHCCRQIFISTFVRITENDRHAAVPLEMGQEGDGWNQVSRKRGRKSAQRPTHDSELPGLGPNPNPGLSLTAIHKYHEKVSQDWLESDCWGALQTTLRDAFPACNRPAITKAVCLGPGPFDPANDNVSIRRTAHMQTEAFRSIVANLGRALHLSPAR